MRPRRLPLPPPQPTLSRPLPRKLLQARPLSPAHPSLLSHRRTLRLIRPPLLQPTRLLTQRLIRPATHLPARTPQQTPTRQQTLRPTPRPVHSAPPAPPPIRQRTLTRLPALQPTPPRLLILRRAPLRQPTPQLTRLLIRPRI